jgi:beta-lactamase class A
MTALLTRRGFFGITGGALSGACAVGGTPPPTPAPQAQPSSVPSHKPEVAAPSPAQTELQQLEARIGGRVGVFARNLGSAEPLIHRADERFAMCSTFKWVLAAAILRKIDRAGVSLSTPIAFGEADLLQYAPVTRQRVQEGHLTLEELMKAAITVSDNTAANLLLNQVSGPAGLTQFLREVGDPTTRLDRNEPMLNTNFPKDERDTTTPRAMAETLTHILTGSVLSATSRELLSGWLVATTTGLGRLRGGLPKEWKAGDKTGTGENGACNDVAVIWPTQCAPWFVASYLSESTAPDAVLFDAHAEIGRIVTQHIGSCS